MNQLCIACKKVPVREEFTRCEPCEAEHQKLVAQLNARPKPEPYSKPEPRWVPANVPGGKLYLDI